VNRAARRFYPSRSEGSARFFAASTPPSLSATANEQRDEE
jgi:hypothetical protein